MSHLTTGMAEQYADSRKLAARARLHTEYTVAETGWFEFVAGRLPLRSGARVLDIGCGPGWFWASAAGIVPEGLDLTLADQSEGMVAEALARCTPLGFAAVSGTVADAAALPFESGSFDLVIAMHMLYHVPDPAAAIAEMARVLAPGGVLAVTTNGIDNLREMYALGTAFGGPPHDPSGAAFGFDQAQALMRARFGAVESARHPARLRITDPEDVFLAMTSYPPGDRAGPAELDAFRRAIETAFARGGGVLETDKQVGLFLGRKS